MVRGSEEGTLAAWSHDRIISAWFIVIASSTEACTDPLASMNGTFSSARTPAGRGAGSDARCGPRH